jgi:hypothetical protein
LTRVKLPPITAQWIGSLTIKRKHGEFDDEMDAISKGFDPEV